MLFSQKDPVKSPQLTSVQDKVKNPFQSKDDSFPDQLFMPLNPSLIFEFSGVTCIDQQAKKLGIAKTVGDIILHINN